MDKEIKILDEKSEEAAAEPLTITSLSCERFIAETAGGNAFPSGGSCAAYAGALGVSLSNMVGSLLAKREIENKNELLELKFDADILQADLVWLASRDAEATDKLIKAYAAEGENKAAAVEAALADAASIPLETMEKCVEAVTLIAGFAKLSDKFTLSNAGSAVSLCLGALKAASFSVLANARLMKDASKASALKGKALYLLGEGTRKADTLFFELFTTLQND